MFLDSKDIPDLQRLIHEPHNGGISKIRGADVSLSVILFLAITHRTLWLARKTSAAGTIAKLGLPGLSRAINCLMETTPTRPRQPFGKPPFELYRITSKKDLQCTEWQSFCDRFRRSADAGRNGEMYYNVADAFGEMGDNVVYHAFESDDKPCPAIAGFHVSNSTAAFCVADYGQGFLKSLHRSPKWEALKTDYDALRAVVNDRATSNPEENEGGGFNDLFSSLLDFNGLVVLRSGAATLYLANKQAQRECFADHRDPVPGASVTTVISPRGQPTEIPVKNIS